MYSDWHVITVLEEMESEGIVVQHSAEPEEQVYKLSFFFKVGLGTFPGGGGGTRCIPGWGGAARPLIP